MKLFGHPIALPSVILPVVDGGTFLAALFALRHTVECTDCVLHDYFQSYLFSLANLAPHEALLLTSAFVVVTASVGLYNRDAILDFRVFFQRFVLSSQFVLIPIIIFLALGKAAANMPFGWYLGITTLAVGLFFTVLFVLRVIIGWALDLPFMKRRVLVVGSGPEAEAVRHFIENHGSSHMRLAGSLRETGFAENSVLAYGNVLLQPQPDTRRSPLAVIAQGLKADEIVLAVDDKSVSMWQLLECKLQGIVVTEYLSFWERETGKLDLRKLSPAWLALRDGFKLNWGRRCFKRLSDITVSLIFLVCFAAPVGLLTALLIKLDSPGPALYRQTRVGRDGRHFTIFKFRSMVMDAEKDGPRWAQERDDRVTRVGKIIRKLRIDETPQVVNVLMGDMSLVGPRPERPEFVDQLKKRIPLYDLRHRVQPGITGWAQVNFRYAASDEDAERKLAYDLYYVKNQDAVLDLVIMLQTVRVFLFSHGSR